MLSNAVSSACRADSTWPFGRGMVPGWRLSWLFLRFRKLLKRSVEAARGMAVRASSCEAGDGEVDCTNACERDVVPTPDKV